MTTKNWAGGSGAWDDAADWLPQGMPGVSDAAVLGAGAAVVIATTENETVASIALTAPTASLTVDGVLQNATVQLGSGQLTGTGTFDNVTFVGTLTTSALTIGGTATFEGPPGQPNLAITAPGGTLTGLYTSDLDTSNPAGLSAGIVLVGSPDLSRPVILQGYMASFSTFDVTGAVEGLNFVGTINLTPGGYLTGSDPDGPIHIEGGTLDISALGAPGISRTYPVSFDRSSGTLVVKNGQVVPIEGFRAGDTIDVKGVSVSGALSPGSSDTLAVGGAQLSLQNQSAPGATYAAVPDGSGGTLVTTTAEPAATVAFTDETTGVTGSHVLLAAAGGPSYLQWQYLEPAAYDNNDTVGDNDTVAMATRVPNVFLRGGGGTKALAVTSGQNVLDGGTGSAFLTGGSGADTFFLDVRIGNNAVWDTLANFHAGDAVTVWGWVPGMSTETVTAQAGAAGHQGATLNLSHANGTYTSEVTFAGLSAAQAAHLQMATGTAGGIPYLYLYNPGV